jgi:hypothetical protein
MQLHRIDYHSPDAKRRRGRHFLAAGALLSLVCICVAATGQVEHFGNCFRLFRVAVRLDYYAYGFTVHSHWIFWHEFALIASVLPLTWLVVTAIGLRRAGVGFGGEAAKPAATAAAGAAGPPLIAVASFDGPRRMIMFIWHAREFSRSRKKGSNAS